MPGIVRRQYRKKFEKKVPAGIYFFLNLSEAARSTKLQVPGLLQLTHICATKRRLRALRPRSSTLPVGLKHGYDFT